MHACGRECHKRNASSPQTGSAGWGEGRVPIPQERSYNAALLAFKDHSTVRAHGHSVSVLYLYNEITLK